MFNGTDAISIRYLIVFLCGILGAQAVGQTHKTTKIDPLYVDDHSSQITARAYASTKFNSLVLRSLKGAKDLSYQPNGNYVLGIGASYRKLTLNIAVPMPLVNNDQDKKGSTKYLDAQGNILSQTRATNLFLQFYEGYHLPAYDPATIGWQQSTTFPYRADLRQFNIGLSTLKIVNSEKFSYRAAFNQDAWQKRSSGSWLYGGYGTVYVVHADSAIVPSRLLSTLRDGTAINKGTFIDLGAMGGYAQTFVYKKHWFFTASAALGFGPSIQSLSVPARSSDRIGTLGAGFHAQWRGALGYNRKQRCVVLFYNQEHVGYIGADHGRFAWNVGNIRLMYAVRLKYKPKKIDEGLKWLEDNSPVPLGED